MLRKLVSTAIAILMVLVAMPALAADSAPVLQEWWHVLVRVIVELLLPVAGVVAVAFAAALARRWGLSIGQSQLEAVIGYGINFAEEQANKVLKAGAVKTSSAEKLDAALKIVQQLIVQFGLPKLTEDKLKALIEAKLAATR